jgi:diaminopimelate epimerase
MASIKLIKMNGTGNDFLIFDARATENTQLVQNVIKNISELSIRSNETTKGCDQFLVLENTDEADVFMRIFNCDGSEVSACGNATRAIGWWISNELSKDTVHIQTKADILSAEQIGDFDVMVDMGKPRLEWNEIPLSHKMNTLEIPITADDLPYPAAVSMGNPHMVFFVNNVNRMDISRIGAPLEVHPFYPEKTNVEFAEVLDHEKIRLRVFERGVGETLACGTGACAAVVAAVRRGLTLRDVEVEVKGGTLRIYWDEDTGHVHLSGKVGVDGSVEVEITE